MCVAHSWGKPQSGRDGAGQLACTARRMNRTHRGFPAGAIEVEDFAQHRQVRRDNRQAAIAASTPASPKSPRSMEKIDISGREHVAKVGASTGR